MNETRLPLVAIIGRPNVGKSTLFNALLGERRAIVSEQAGTTRDTLMERIKGDQLDFWLLDTAGLSNAKGDSLEQEVQRQVSLTSKRADLILFIVDGRLGISPEDRDVLEMLRKGDVPFLLVANKIDDGDETRALEFSEFGYGVPSVVSAKNFTHIWELETSVQNALKEQGFVRGESIQEDGIIHVAIVGRPNVGKSSLINALLGEARLVVSEQQGTTRDSIDVDYTDEKGQVFRLIDTAGLRRPGKRDEDIEYWSSVRTKSAIERADICVVLIDALDGVTHQDMSIAGDVIEQGKGLVIGVNKFDLMQEKSREQEETDEREVPGVTTWGESLDLMRRKFLGYLADRMPFCSWAPALFFSAKTGKGIQDIFSSAQGIQEQRARRIATADLNRFVPEIMFGHVAPSKGTKKGKIKYISQVDTYPPKFVFFVNNAAAFHFSYRRYVENKLREKYGFYGTPIRLDFRDAMDKKRRR